MTELEFQKVIIDLAHLGRWIVSHFRPAMLANGAWVTPVAADGKGFPDLVLVHAERRRVLFRELKSNTGEPTEEQRMWLRTLREAGADAAIWWPDQLEGIKELLIG